MRRGVLLAAGALALMAAPAGAAETGCPLTWSALPGAPVLAAGIPEPDDDVGPFSGASQRLRALSFAVDQSGGLAIGVRVEDMRRAVRPGYRWTYWMVDFDVEGRSARRSSAQVFYDALLDEYSAFAYAGGFPGFIKGTVAVTPGPGGGFVARFPLSAFRVEHGGHLLNVAAESGDFLSYTYMNADPADPHTWPSGVYFNRWDMAGPPSVPLIGCPAVRLEAFDRGNGQGAEFAGDALPVGSAVAIEVREGGTWRPLTDAVSDETGGYGSEAALPPGSYTFRAVALSPSSTPSVSEIVTVELTD